jgi:hypothetical protein|nr:MAG TPA_asm: hypothetical protein [Caudoviricetes sp.]
MRIDIRDLPLTFDFNRHDNSYEVRNNKGLLIEALKNDYVAIRYLIDVIGIDEEAAERIVEYTFLAGLSKPII